MNYRIQLSDKSERDIRDIYEYISNTLLAPLNAVTVFNRITEAILSLRTMPERHKIYKTGSNGEKIRFLVSGNHIIYYWTDHSALQVNVICIMVVDKEPESRT